jgi:hypothetical protein
MLDNSIEALTQARDVFTPAKYIRQRARVQRYIADAFSLRAAASIRQNKVALLKQATDAYAEALAATGSKAVWGPLDQAKISMAQAQSAFQLGGLLDGSQSLETLALAAEAAKSAVDQYKALNERDLAVTAYRLLATVETDYAGRAETSMRLEWIDKAIQSNEQVFALLGKGGAKELRAQVRLDLARLFWTRVTVGDDRPPAVVGTDLDATLANVEQALGFYSGDTASAEYK